MTLLQLLVGLLTLVSNAFFCGGEFALVSVRRSQIEPAAERGDRRARITLWGLEHLSAVMATAQLGITASSLVLGAVAEPAVSRLLEPVLHAAGLPQAAVAALSLAVALALATYLHMLVGEMVPKNVALAAPTRTALLLGPPMVALTRALLPLVSAVNALADGVLRLLRVETRQEVAAVYSDTQLARLVVDSSQAGLLDPADGERLRDALELGTRPVGEILVPLQRMVTADHTTTPAQLERAATSAGFSRLPVIGPGGEVLGYLHIKDALGVADRDRPFPRTALHAVTRVAIDTPLDDALTAMRANGGHLAAVTGERGTVLGFVTMEDVLTELVGPAA